MDWSDYQAVERVPNSVLVQLIVKGAGILVERMLEIVDLGYTPGRLTTEIYEGLPIDRAHEILRYTERQRAAHPAWSKWAPQLPNPA